MRSTAFQPCITLGFVHGQRKQSCLFWALNTLKSDPKLGLRAESKAATCSVSGMIWRDGLPFLTWRMGYFFWKWKDGLLFFNLKDGLLSVPSSENMAPCRDDASVSLLPNMRVIPLCQGDGRMIHLVQRVCNNVQSIWYNYNVSVMMYLCTIHLAQCTCCMQFLSAQYARHATVPRWM